MKCVTSDKIGVTFVYRFELRKYDFRRRWSATPKNRERSIGTTHGQTAPKSEGDRLSAGSYLQGGSAPPPPLRGYNPHTLCDQLWFRG